jgi:hypothetical protein
VRNHLLRAFDGWTFEYPIHEVPVRRPGGEAPNRTVYGLVQNAVYHVVPKARPKERFMRDAEILKAYLADHPDHPRTQFYLAQSYNDAAEWDLALRWFRARAANPEGWDEERWYAQYRAFLIVKHLKRSQSEVIHEALKAYNMRPSRCEPLFHLARHLRGDPRALPFAMAAAGIERTGDSLHVESALYDWAAVDEACTAASAAGQVPMAMMYAQRAVSKCPPSEYKRLYESMCLFQTQMAAAK